MAAIPESGQAGHEPKPSDPPSANSDPLRRRLPTWLGRLFSDLWMSLAIRDPSTISEWPISKPP